MNRRPEHSVDGNKESQSIASRQKKPQRALALKLFLLIGAVSLIVMAVYGLVTRSATTENLQRQANQAYAELAVSVVNAGKGARHHFDRSAWSDPGVHPGASLRPNDRLCEEMEFRYWFPRKGRGCFGGDRYTAVDEQLNQAKATLKQEQATLDLSRVTVQRDQDLLQRKVIAQQDFDTAKDNFRE